MPVRYEEILPSPVLAPFVEAFWQFDLGPNDPEQVVHTIVPDAAVSLAASFWQGALLGVELVGPSQTAQQARIVQGMTVIGVRLCPGAAPLLLDIAPVDHLDRMQSLPPDHWATAMFAAVAGNGLRGLGAAMEQRVARLPTPDALIAQAATAIESGAGVGEVAAGLGLSPRQLQRRFQRATGLAPKAWQRVRRQRHAWISLVSGKSDNLTGAAHSAGFADSAHFSRETRRSFRWSAEEVAAYLSTIAHGSLRQPPGAPEPDG